MKTRNSKTGILGFSSSLELRTFRSSSRSARGFALIELLVAVVLFGVITSFIILAYNRVGGQIFVTTLAYEIALSFREAQSYGMSVHAFRPSGGSGAGDFDVGYGIHFDSRNLGTYLMFADQGGQAGDGLFNGTYGTEYNSTGCISTTECIRVFKIEKGNLISKFCGMRADNGAEDCHSATTTAITFLDVAFLRPNPDAIITTSETVLVGQKYKAASVHLRSPTGENRKVEVWNTGQISIK